MARRGILAACLSFALCGCQSTDIKGWLFRPLSTEAEALAGKRAAPALERRFGGLYVDAGASRRMELVGEKLARVAPCTPGEWRFQLLASRKMNAFSLPGGRVYLTRGLYARVGSDDRLLAAVIAHEMAHIIRKDGFKPSCGSVEEAICREIEADLRGAECLVAAGYSPHCMIDLLRLTADAHPDGWARVRIKRLAQRYPPSSSEAAVAAAYR